MAPLEVFMKVNTTSTKSSSGATEKCENKISRQFQMNRNPEIFEA